MDIRDISDDDYERLARYISGEAGDAERLEIERWIAERPDGAALVESMRATWAMSADADSRWDADAAWQRFSDRSVGVFDGRHAGVTPIGESAPAVAPSVTPGAPPTGGATVLPFAPSRRKRALTERWMAIAATMTLLIGAGVLWPRLRDVDPGDSSVKIASKSERAFATTAGERRTIRLMDGSEVVLGASSNLRIRGELGPNEGTREVELEGQAFFTVTHDTNRPFRVHVGSTVVEDLGTEFDVRAYAGDARLRVVVASGSVALRRGTTTRPEAVLAPRDMAVVATGGSITLTRAVDVAPLTAWRTGRLVFDDAPLDEVARELGRWYGVDVRISDARLVSRHLTTTFENESLDEVLRVIGMTLNVRYVRTGQTVEFTGAADSGAAPGGSGSAGVLTPAVVPARHEAGV